MTTQGTTPGSADEFLASVIGWKGELSGLGIADQAAISELDEVIAEASAARLSLEPDPAITILLLGATGAGKSELLNALAGERIAKSHYLRPTTTQPTLYLHHDAPEQARARVLELMQQDDKEPLVVSHSRDTLRSKLIIDAPDIDSFQTEHRDLVSRLLPAVDVALYVTTPLSYKDETGWQIMMTQRGQRAFAFIINKWDSEGKPGAIDDIVDVDEDFRRLIVTAGYSKPLIFRVSAKGWIEHLKDGSARPAFPGEEFTALQQWLGEGLSINDAERIRLRRQHILWARLGQKLEASLPPVVDRDKCAEILDELSREARDQIRHSLEIASGRHAQRISQERYESARFTTPGLIGATGAAAEKIASRVKPAPVGLVADDVSQSVRDNTRRILEATKEQLEWRLQYVGRAREQLLKTWTISREKLEEEIGRQYSIAATRAESRALNRFRRGIGIALLVIIELAATALVGIALYRTAQGFLKAQYASPELFLNLLLLLVGLLVLAQVARHFAFVSSPRGIAKKISRSVMQGASHSFEELNRECLAFLNQVNATRVTGESLRDTALTQARKIQLRLDDKPHSTDDLFSGAGSAVHPAP